MRSNTSVTPVSVKIYHDTKGARGAEVLMVPRVETDNDHENNKENDHETFAGTGEDDLSENLPKKKQETRLKSTFVASPYIKEKDLTKFAESMKKLTIKERE
uniref:Uncharacterized protein n=2 Tax=Tetranychus urticae TaxID=32264 RepID=T1KFB0_TETUR